MKYESNILERLIKTYGVVGNPKYVSEIIKQFIIQGKECYPNLFTYQSDWLAHIDEFGLKPTYTVSYTGQSIYAPNTLERPVKSAILKGNTLVNLSENLATVTRNVDFWYKEEKLLNDIRKLKRNTDYTVLYKLENVSGNHENYSLNEIGIGDTGFHKNIPNTIKVISKNGDWCKIKFQLTDSFIAENPTYTEMYIRPIRRGTTPVEGESITYTIKGFAILEGDYTVNAIPFNEVFEGMQSVKMPVLKTVGKNLFEGNIIGNYYVNIDGGLVAHSECYATDFIEIKPNTNFSTNNRDNEITAFYNEDKNFISCVQTKTFLSPSNARFLRTTIKPLSLLDTFQLEEGTTTTPYEPYKSNILTVNEEVELRGIGNIKDELNVATGELTERIGEIVLDGSKKSELWSVSSSDFLRFYVQYNGVKGGNCYSDKFINYQSQSGVDSNFESVVSIDDGFTFVIAKNKLTTQDANGFDKWLSQNPTTIQYQLQTESIKTVDLTILDQNGQSVDHLKSFNGGTHAYTSSLEGSLVPSVDISVVTNLEETLKICSLEGNTM